MSFRGVYLPAEKRKHKKTNKRTRKRKNRAHPIVTFLKCFFFSPDGRQHFWRKTTFPVGSDGLILTVCSTRIVFVFWTCSLGQSIMEKKSFTFLLSKFRTNAFFFSRHHFGRFGHFGQHFFHFFLHFLGQGTFVWGSVQMDFLIRPLGHGEQIFLDGRTELPFLGWDIWPLFT